MLEKLLGFIVHKDGKAIVVSRYWPASPFVLGPTLDFYEPSIIKSAAQYLPIARLLVLYAYMITENTSERSRRIGPCRSLRFSFQGNPSPLARAVWLPVVLRQIPSVGTVLNVGAQRPSSELANLQ